MPDLFISYARGDSRDFVARLSEALEARGKDTWVDLDDIPPASSWNDDLRAGISASDSFAFVISPRSVASPHCRAELEHAVALGKRILPVLHLPVPDEEVPEPVATRNWIPQLGRFTDDFDTSVATLVTAVETDLDWVREHTRWGLRAQEWERREEDRSLLARGSDLEAAERFISGGSAREPRPTELQGRYVLESRRAASRRQRQLVGGVSVALVVSLVLGVLALLQRNTAVEQRHEAEEQRADATSRALAANAFLTLPRDPELSVLLGLQAAAASPTEEAEEALRSGILSDRVRMRLTEASEVTSAVYSPDGRQIVTTSAAGSAALWDAATGQQLATLSSDVGPSQARWSADGSRLVTVAGDGRARVWDGATGAPISEITDPDDPRLSDAAISSDGSVVVTAGFVHNRVRLWDAATGDGVGTIRRATVDRLALSPDDRLLLLARQNRDVELWSTETVSEVARYRQDGQEFFTAAAFSPDGRLFATAGADGRVVVRGLDGGKVAEVAYADEATALAFSPDGSLLASSSRDGTAKVTDLSSGATVTTFSGHDASVTDVAFSSDGTMVASSDADGLIQLWLPGSGALVATLAGHAGPVNSVSFSPQSDLVVSASDDRTAIVWSASPSGGGLTRTHRLDLGEGLRDAVLSPDGARALLDRDGDTGEQLVRVDTATGATEPGYVLAPTQSWLPTTDARAELTVVQDFGGEKPLAEVRRVADGAVVATLEGILANGAALDGAGRRVAVVGDDGAAAVYDAGSGARLVTLEGHDPALPVEAVAFSPDGSEVVTGSLDGSARIWDVATGRQLTSIEGAFGPVPPRNLPTMHLALSEDGSRLVTGSIYESTANLWDAASGALVARIDGVDGGTTGVAFSPSGRLLLMTDYNGNSHIWDGVDGRRLSLVSHVTGSAVTARFDAEERQIEVIGNLSGEGEGRAVLDVFGCDVCGGLRSLVTLARARVTRELTATEKATYLDTG